MNSCKTSYALSILVAVSTSLGAACKHSVAYYCDENTSCADRYPDRPYCDLDGTHSASEGIGHTCIPDPFAGPDAGVDADSTATLTLSLAGTGSGTVFSDPLGIQCDAEETSCQADFRPGTSITLSTTPATSSDFIAWSAAGCSNAGDCTFELTGDTTVTATFELKQYALEIIKSGDGTGTVASTTPEGISCGSDCSESFAHGTHVTLAAAGTGGAAFGGWSGDCAGLTTPCVLEMNGEKTVGAAFDLNLVSLSVSFHDQGTGAGTVTSNVGGIDCPGTCAASVAADTEVVLTAQPDAGSSLFAGWSGACSGTAPCTVTVSASTNVVARFNRITYALTLNKTGDGSGIVTSDPVGISCVLGCDSDSGTFDAGTSVRLEATAAAGSAFVSWTGCTGFQDGDCLVTMNANTNITAEFYAVPPGMAYIPAGPFVMGSDVGEGEADEWPEHEVSLSAYNIDVHEVTNAEWRACVTAGGCTAPSSPDSRQRTDYYTDPTYDGYPVIEVDWDQASAYCLWAGKRLPTEAEWEKAARGGCELVAPSTCGVEDEAPYPWGDVPPTCSMANGRLSAGSFCVTDGDTDAVGARSPAGNSPYGVQDMAGNVAEWVADWYSDAYYSTSPATDPPGPPSGTGRGLRGGNWSSTAPPLRVANRFGFDPTLGSTSVGVRCARAP